MSTETSTPGGGTAGGDRTAVVPSKGLHAGILDLGDSVMLGLASTAPVYSLAATLGLIVAVNGNYTPLILVLGFIPVLFIAYAFRELNSAMPDCGTTFFWARKAFGPWAGWLGGWGVALAGIVVLANLAQIAGKYLWLLVGDGSLAENKWLVTATGVLFIVFMTYVNHRGIRLGEHVQRTLTYIQYISLGIFAVAIIFRIAGGAPEGQAFDFEWFNPAGAFADPGAVVHGALLALFIYWGWDTCLALNEETENPAKTPGRGAVISASVLVAIYVSVALLVMMYATIGTDGIGLGNEANQDDVFLAMKDVVLGPWGWLIVVAVLASVLSSTQTTILPTARGTLSMGVHGALPARFGKVHERFMTPGFSTQVMGAVAVVYYVAMSFLSENLLSDSISAISLFIAFYYALTGFSCVWYFRSTLRDSARNLWFRGILPLLGALSLTAAFFISAVQMWDPAYGDTQIFGIGGAFVSGVLLLVLGVVLAIVCRFAPSTRAYFTGERADAGVVRGE
ncbi:amino acid transporter [Arthrobacter sp. NtRootA4]|nr:amino acid transporter [Arthrobacter sp. NtRootA2]BCW15785.1 amino acid transporter [Arthrobacter sp. NtRootA4]BCW24118.1 amino acid transporter [Arthrobacter sp. NtRootC7]BCW28386.1 amino acid transporter [Arthrobacter sp. NtRootC45]BCW32657.1 amino acid transporter [Arthrobacter sp. NtRootD5]